MAGRAPNFRQGYVFPAIFINTLQNILNMDDYLSYTENPLFKPTGFISNPLASDDEDNDELIPLGAHWYIDFIKNLYHFKYTPGKSAHSKFRIFFETLDRAERETKEKIQIKCFYHHPSWKKVKAIQTCRSQLEAFLKVTYPGILEAINDPIGSIGVDTTQPEESQNVLFKGDFINQLKTISTGTTGYDIYSFNEAIHDPLAAIRINVAHAPWESAVIAILSKLVTIVHTDNEKDRRDIAHDIHRKVLDYLEALDPTWFSAKKKEYSRSFTLHATQQTCFRSISALTCLAYPVAMLVYLPVNLSKYLCCYPDGEGHSTPTKVDYCLTDLFCRPLEAPRKCWGEAKEENGDYHHDSHLFKPAKQGCC
jgi:hypothetical protein